MSDCPHFFRLADGTVADCESSHINVDDRGLGPWRREEEA